MRAITRAGMVLVAIAALFAFAASSASANGARQNRNDDPPFHHPAPPPFHLPPPGHANHPVFVQTDNTAGNQVIAYDQAANGSLTQAGAYHTGGLGGVLEGSVVDHLASQGSLAYDSDNRPALRGQRRQQHGLGLCRLRRSPRLRQVIGSGGAFPVSVAVSHGLVYVLNAEEGGSLQGYRVLSGTCSRSPDRPRARPRPRPQPRSSSTRRARSPSRPTARS